MVLWVDKYRPTSLDKLELHENVTERLRKLVAAGDFPHLLFYGPSGAGKKTRIMAILREIYGAGVEKVKVDYKTFKPKSKAIEITTVGSNYHIELNPSDVGMNDRYVVQEVVKEMAAAHTLDPAHQKAFKIVVLNEVDRLSREAQNGLRRTMEKYSSTCRLILVCESTCRVIEPLKSRCLGIRIPAPTIEEVVDVLRLVAKKERLTLPDELAERIARESQRNLRRAILMLEACKAEQTPLKEDQKVRTADWEQFIDLLGRSVTEQQTPQRLLLARNKVYELLTNCIPPDVVMKALTQALLKRVDDTLKHEIIHWAAYYEHRMKIGSKPIFHIEAFIAKFMALYKKWVVESFG